MDASRLSSIAHAMVQPGKGVLAADESTGTIGKKLEKIGVENNEANRQAYRDVLLTAPGLGNYISGVILYDETIRQNALDGRSFVSILNEAGVFPGIKVDKGPVPMNTSPEEKVTVGLDGLPERLREYVNLGAKFCKWRAVLSINNGNPPTDANLHDNGKALALYARMCQDVDLVPVVEPEVLMDGSHTIEQCSEASERALSIAFEEFRKENVLFEGLILKTNMIVPGKESGQKATPEEVADRTVSLFKKLLPDTLAGQIFLSGGQSEVEATENLNAINLKGPFPWNLSFSYGRALQDSALKIWAGKAENKTAAQNALLHRAKMNSLATLGKYDPSMEKI